MLDSNIIIGAANSGTGELVKLLQGEEVGVSAVSRVEVLGYHKLADDQILEFGIFFRNVQIFPVDDAIIDRAIAIRQIRKMSLGDALIAATALVHQLTLVTRNVADFVWIDGLRVIDPGASLGT